MSVLAQMPSVDSVAAGFKNVPSEARLRMFWRVFGPAWSKAEIDYELEELERAGVGGVMTCFTYPVALDNAEQGVQNQRFLSPEFLETLRYAAQKAKAEGIAFGVCGGTGWPYGGPMVSTQDAAQRLRMEMPKPLPEGQGYALPKLRAGERYVAAFCGSKNVTANIHGERLETTETGTCRVFISGPTYMQVKRAALGGEGYVIDHFNKEATLRYLNAAVAPMVQAVPESTLRSVFCDSLEVYSANWTHDLPQEFQKRRGYDLAARLPELFDDQAPAALDLRFDLWRTLAELAEERFARTVHHWLKRRGIAFALEAYGTPSMGFTAARYCDVPWGEQYEWKGFSFSRFASSGAHLAGKNIVGSEAWTWAGLPNRLADSLADLKLCSDIHFLSGANELTGVDYPYSPRAAGIPGWTPYYGPVLNQNNPQWLCFRDFADYVSRCQWLLRQGRPIADVALYTPTEDALAQGGTGQLLLDFQLRDRFVTGEKTDEFGLKKGLQHHSDLIHTVLTQGYNFDGIDFFAMNTLAKVKGAELVAGDGRYRVVVLPNLVGMDLAALEKLARFCKAGGTLIATRRLLERVYGYHREAETAKLRALLGELFGAETPAGFTVRTFGKGHTIFTPDERDGLGKALQTAFPPDVHLTPFQPEVSHVHRQDGTHDFYFLVNVGEREATFTADFRVSGKAASLWNPMNGEITPLPVQSTNDGRTQIALTLPPHGSVFIGFAPGEPKIAPVPAPPAESVMPLALAWQVTFEGADAPQPYETHELSSWTQWPGAKFFSGRATYTGTFDLPSVPAHSCLLRFTQVRECAEVVVNGQRVGSVWTPPYELDVTQFLKPGANTLQITVGNLMVNRVLGLPDPDLSSLHAVYGERFPAPEEKHLMSEPAPSGLIGPVTLVVKR